MSTLVTTENANCTLTGAETGTGAMNRAAMEIDDTDYEDTACQPFPAISTDKEVTSGPTPLGDSQYEIVYTLTATNTGPAPGTYTLDDELTFGADITIDSAELELVGPAGIVVNPSWDGVGDNNVVTGQAIAAAPDGGETVHTFQVTVVVTIDGDVSPTEADCDVETGETGSGLRNTTTMTGDFEDTDDACAEAPVTEFDKELVSVTPNGDGTFTLVYELTVERTGTGAPYTLTDELLYGPEVTVDSVVVTSTTPAGLPFEVDFDGVGQPIVAETVDIDHGETHVYEVTVVADVDPTAATFATSDCSTTTGGPNSGFRNAAAVESNDTTVTDEACETFPAVTMVKALTGGPTPVGSGDYEYVYTITVTNRGAGAGRTTSSTSSSSATASRSCRPTSSTRHQARSSSTRPGTGRPRPPSSRVRRSPPRLPPWRRFTRTVSPSSSRLTRPSRPKPPTAPTTPARPGPALGTRRSITSESGEGTGEDCGELPRTEFDKDLVSATSNGDGTFTLQYDLTVSRTGDGAPYTLTDSLRYGTGITVEVVGVFGTEPLGLPFNPAFNGVGDPVVAADVPISDGETHMYHVTVVADVDAGAVTFESSDCDLTTGETGTGFTNVAATSTNGSTITDEACVELPAITTDKDLTSGPTPVGAGRYELVYSVTATNAGAAAGTYDLADALTYGEGTTIVSGQVTDATPAGIVPNPAWNGLTEVDLVTGQPIAAGTAGTPTVHTFEITVVVEVDPDITDQAADCVVDPGEAGTGFTNQATLDGDSGPDEAEVCVRIPVTRIDKELTDVTPNGDGSYTLTYELTVSRTGAGGAPYTLTDALAYGAAVTIDGVAVTATDPAGLTTNAGFDGVGDTTVATAVTIGDGETHVYTVTVEATVDAAAVTFENSDCEQTTGESGTGFANAASVGSNGTTVTDEDCEPLSGVTSDKEITAGPTALGSGQYEIEYTLTATNNGAGAGSYTLTDQLSFGTGTTIVSAAVANTAGGVTVDPAWNGIDVTTIVAGQAITGATAAGPEQHSYTVTVVFEVDPAIDPAAADCDPATGAPNTGLLNEAEVTGPSGPDEAEACTEVPDTDFDKELVGVTSNGDGTYTIAYELTVSREGVDTTYDLTDSLLLGEPVTVAGPITVVNTVPGGVTLNPGFDGVADTLIADDVPISDGDTHVYTMTVVVAVDLDAVTFENSNCDLTTGESGTGAMNQASVAADGVTVDDEDCTEFPATSMTKTVDSGPTALGGGEYGITYLITVTNSGAGDDEYDLDDELSFGDGINVVSTVATNTAGGVTVSPTWDGIADHTIVADQPIAGATATGATVHTFEIDVVFTVDPDITPTAANCTTEPGEGGTGLLNGATIFRGAGTAESHSCVQPPVTRFDKELVDVEAHGDGTFTLTYELTVQQFGQGGVPYTLNDTLEYGDAVTVDSVAVTADPVGLPANPAFDGVADTVVATGVAIADGVTHTYTVTVEATVDAAEVTFENSDCPVGPGEAGSGFANTAGVTTNGSTITDEACEEFPSTTVDKEITSGPMPTGSGLYEIEYTLTVENSGAAPDVYDLTDALEYGVGMTIISSEIVNSTPGTIAVNPAWNGIGSTTVVAGADIAAATSSGPAVHVYTVTVVVDIPVDIDPAAADCTTDPGEGGTGLSNTAALLTGGTDASEDTECAEVPSTDVDKAITATIANGDGSYTLTYTLTVTRDGDGPSYDLTDALRVRPRSHCRLGDGHRLAGRCHDEPGVRRHVGPDRGRRTWRSPMVSPTCTRWSSRRPSTRVR